MAELWSAIVAGSFAGLVLALLVGPVFFALLQVSIEKGFLTGLVFAMGIISSDATYFLFAFLGVSQIGQSPVVNQVMGICGGTFLMLFGLKLALKKFKPKEKQAADLRRTSLAKSYFQGFLLNIVNPAVLFYWIGVVTAISANYEGNPKKIFAFFMASMLIVFSTDTLKAFLAYKLKDVITATFMLWLNRFSGSILILGGAKLLWDAAKNLLPV